MHVHRTKTDFGPITKLAGALEYIRTLPESVQERLVLITLDDDLRYPVWQCENLLRWAARYPNEVVMHAGAHYEGRPQSVEYFVRAKGQREMGYYGAAAPAGRASANPIITDVRNRDPRPPSSCTSARSS